MLCWATVSDSHGFTLYNPIWVPEGEYPDKPNNYERLPHMDFERTDAKQLDMRFNGDNLRLIRGVPDHRSVRLDAIRKFEEQQ